MIDFRARASAAAFRGDREWDAIHDTVVYGAGLTGVAAALALAASGEAVTLVDARGDLLWEITRSFAAADRDDPDMRRLLAAAEAALPRTARMGFAAWIEIAVARLLAGRGIRVLFYARPVAAAGGEGGVTVRFASKGGLDTLRVRRILDASETGEVARALGMTGAASDAVAFSAAMVLRGGHWPDDGSLEPGDGPTERVIRVRGEAAALPELLADRLMRFRSAEPGEDAPLVALSSYRPLPDYAPGAAPDALPVEGRVVVAAPAGRVAELGDRLRLGLRAADAIRKLPRAPAAEPPPAALALPPAKTLHFDVAVCGGGTAGAVAALAAAREGARVVCADILDFPGGTSTASGIHSYWFGASGGLQEEVDDLVEALSPLYGTRKQVRGFHPDARRLALARLLREAGVTFLPDAMLYGAARDGRRVRAADFATARGAVRVEADVFVDSTGDGDLCAHGGASFSIGRDSDGLASPYTQSAVAVSRKTRFHYLEEINYDSGWVAPEDPGDLTRARLEGLEQLAGQLAAGDGPDYLAVSPVVGLRQSRQIDTAYRLGLDDLIERRTFEDAVGYTAAHFDNHMLDYELEGPDAVFWVWCAQQWRTPVACQIPVRILMPEGLDNVLVACRALGVSRDAHHAFRMMRDMSRVGEAAGRVAARAAAGSGSIREPAALAGARPGLQASGALRPPAGAPRQTRFGPDGLAHASESGLSREAAVAALRDGVPSPQLWRLYKGCEAERALVAESLRSNRGDTSWLAACIAGLNGDAEAEPRLLDALVGREAGTAPDTSKYNTDPEFRPFPPRWVVAVAVLRHCGSDRAVAPLLALIEDEAVGLDVKIAVALALGDLHRRGHPVEAARLAAVAAKVAADRGAAVPLRPQQFLLEANGGAAPALPAQTHDGRWKLAAALAPLLDALAVARPGAFAALADDPRLHVREALKPTRQPAAG